MSGKMYDDAANGFLLHSYFRLDAYGSHQFGSRFEIFAAGENLTNRAIEVSRPRPPLATPIVGRVGVLIHLGAVSR